MFLILVYRGGALRGWPNYIPDFSRGLGWQDFQYIAVHGFVFVLLFMKTSSLLHTHVSSTRRSQKKHEVCIG